MDVQYPEPTSALALVFVLFLIFMLIIVIIILVMIMFHVHDAQLHERNNRADVRAATARDLQPLFSIFRQFFLFLAEYHTHARSRSNVGNNGVKLIE